MARVFTIIQRLNPGAIYDVTPPVTQDWEVTDLGSDAIVGVPPAGLPNVLAGLVGPAGVNALLRNTTIALPATRGWRTPAKWLINNTTRLRVANGAAAAQNIAITINLQKHYGNIVSTSVISATALLIATGVAVIRPPLGQDWVITDIGSTRWVGAGANGLPNVEVRLTDGVNAVLLADGANARGWDRNWELYLNNACWLELTNPAGAGATVGWSGAIARQYSPTHVSQVISRVLAVPGGLVVDADIRPPAGEEWMISDIGCDLWTIAGAPANLPDVLVQMNNDVLVSTVQAGTDNKGWLDKMAYYLTNSNYMTLTPTAPGFVGVSGYKWRE